MHEKWMRYLARASAIAWGCWWTLFGVLSGVGEQLEPVGVLLHAAVPGVAFLVAALIAWRWELPGGLLLVLEGLLTLAAFEPFATTIPGLLTLSLPGVFAGLLFVADWMLSRPAGRASYHV